MGQMGISRQREGYGRFLLEFQVVVVGALLIVGTAVLLTRHDTIDLVTYASGAGLILLVTAATIFWRQNSQLQRLSLLLPLLDTVGIRLTVFADHSPQPGGALLLILPVVWIAYSFGHWGFVICLALVAVTTPGSF